MAQERTKAFTTKEHSEAAVFATLDSIKHEIDRSVNSEVGSLSYQDVFSGRRDSLKSLRGKIELVSVWSIACPPCIREMPILRRAQSELGNRGFVLLAISRDDSAKQRAFFAGRKVRLDGIAAMTRDADCSYPFATYFNPSAYLVDRKGILREFCIGPKTNEDLTGTIAPYL